MGRLVETERLVDAPVTMVAIDEVYDADGRLRQPPATDRDFPRAIAKLGRGLKPRTVGTYRPYIGAYWQLCLARDARLEDAALFRGFVLAVSRHVSGKPSLSTLQVVTSAVGSLLSALAMPSPLRDPATQHWLRAEMKTRTRRKPRRSEPVMAADIATALASTDDLVQAGGGSRLHGLRDRALILLGWTCALRRSELVAVRPEHLRRTRGGGWELVLPVAKTSDGEDQIVPVVRSSKRDFDAVSAVTAWIEAAGIRAGSPLFRRMFRDGSLGAAGLNPTAVRTILRSHGLRGGISPHGLRSGFVTQARLNGAANHQIRVVTRHKSDAMLDIYTRQVDPERQGPGSLVP